MVAMNNKIYCVSILAFTALFLCLSVFVATDEDANSLELNDAGEGSEGGTDGGEIQLSSKQVLQRWQSQSCTQLKKLIQQKASAISSVNDAKKKLSRDTQMSNDEKQLHVSRFDAFVQELDQTEHLIVSSLHWLDEVLQKDYKNSTLEMQNSKARLNMLRDAVLKEEQEYQILSEAEAQLVLVNGTGAGGMMGGILKNVARAADQLEDELDDHAFNNALNDPANGGAVEAVLKIKEVDEDDTQSQSNNTADTEEGVMRLVDVQDNQYTMSKGKDTTVPHEDHTLIRDIILLMILSFLLGSLCTVLHLPAMFGYILTGLILGPSGMNILKSLVQIETLGEFGVFFIMFAVGLEFSPDKIKKVFKVAVVGCSIVTGVMIASGVCIGLIVGAGPNESAFVSACFSLSSTPLIVRFLSAGSSKNDEDGYVDYSLVLLGILIMQDVCLGLLMAVLPSMAYASINTNQQEPDKMVITYALLVGKIVLSLGFMLLFTFALKFAIISPLFRFLIKKDNKELIVMTSIALTFTMLMTTNYLRLSMELGCFIAGVCISSLGHEVADKIENTMEPIKDFLSCIFFASIGLHVFPTFMLYQVTYLTIFTVVTVAAKFVVSVLVLTVMLPHSSKHIKWVVSAGLAQVSEFSFVLGSRARRLGLISRETYLLILSITTLSLLLAPLLWKVAIKQLRLKQYASWGGPLRGELVELKEMESNSLESPNYGKMAIETREER